ncbi:hypothetical protein K491DRAFT_784511 [Lophiostoma macrostomum CBS 122681]|uniref:Uncharacterized protein n=1 Tax=Lophiostoma macrostomum CBS 122681 TaxID=1314788 RepID=A0A6A6SJ18_9PLEO|nr:hypothetical protein K491DRAFT_784511 [Lophiostoma macrostomum CBS 122681]
MAMPPGMPYGEYERMIWDGSDSDQGMTDDEGDEEMLEEDDSPEWPLLRIRAVNENGHVDGSYNISLGYFKNIVSEILQKQDKTRVVSFRVDIKGICAETLRICLQCIAPAPLKTLPSGTVDISRMGNCLVLGYREIEWNFKTLSDIYLAAQTLNLVDVMDMTMDRWHSPPIIEKTGILAKLGGGFPRPGSFPDILDIDNGLFKKFWAKANDPGKLFWASVLSRGDAATREKLRTVRKTWSDAMIAELSDIIRERKADIDFIRLEHGSFCLCHVHDQATPSAQCYKRLKTRTGINTDENSSEACDALASSLISKDPVGSASQPPLAQVPKPRTRTKATKKYQALIQWKNDYNLTYEQCRQLWIASGYLIKGKPSISITGLQHHHSRYKSKYYEEKGTIAQPNANAKQVSPLTLSEKTAPDTKRSHGSPSNVIFGHFEAYRSELSQTQIQPKAKDVLWTQNTGVPEPKNSGPSAKVDELRTPSGFANGKKLKALLHDSSLYQNATGNVVSKAVASTSTLDNHDTDDSASEGMEEDFDVSATIKPNVYSGRDHKFYQTELLRLQNRHVPPNASPKDEDRFWANHDGSVITLVRYNHDGRVIAGTEPLSIDANAAAKYSNGLHTLLQEDPFVTSASCPSGASRKGIARFIQCISPVLRSDLPLHEMHVSTNGTELPRLKSKPIEWTMDDLTELYDIATYYDAPHVKDMITDSVQARFVYNSGAPTNLETDPSFINKLATDHDIPGLNFWVDLVLAGKIDADANPAITEHWSDATRDAIRSREQLLKEPRDRLRLPIEDQLGYCKEYHHHDCAEKDSCYKQISYKRLREEEILELAEFAIVLGLTPLMFRMQKKLREARANRDDEACANARAAISRIQKNLENARKFGNINDFVETGEVVGGKYVKFSCGTMYEQWLRSIRQAKTERKKVLRETTFELVKQLHLILQGENEGSQG